jgi:hypothetical protein
MSITCFNFYPTQKKMPEKSFHKTHTCSTTFCKQFLYQFHQNLTNSYFLTLCHKETVRCDLHIPYPYSLFHKECLKITCTQMLKELLFIIFVGVTGKSSFQFCCFLMCQTHLVLSRNCSLAIFIIVFKQSLQKWKTEVSLKKISLIIDDQ